MVRGGGADWQTGLWRVIARDPHKHLPRTAARGAQLQLDTVRSVSHASGPPHSRSVHGHWVLCQALHAMSTCDLLCIVNIGQTDPCSDEGRFLGTEKFGVFFFLPQLFFHLAVGYAIVMRFTSYRIADGRRLVC